MIFTVFESLLVDGTEVDAITDDMIHQQVSHQSPDPSSQATINPPPTLPPSPPALPSSPAAHAGSTPQPGANDNSQQPNGAATADGVDRVSGTGEATPSSSQGMAPMQVGGKVPGTAGAGAGAGTGTAGPSVQQGLSR